MQIKSIKIKDILKTIQGDLITGQPEQTISTIGPDGITFAFSKNSLPNKYFYLVTTAELAKDLPNIENIITVANPRLAFAQFLTSIASIQSKRTIAKSACIDPSSKLGENITIADNVVIEANVSIGNNCIIEAGSVIKENVQIANNTTIKANVTIYPNTIIGFDSTIHANSVIGADGFGYERLPNNTWFKIPHIGNVIIGNHTEIGAATTIDRGTISATTIGNGVKIDNHCQIAHNVQIGDNVLISGCSAVAGSTIIGSEVILGGRVSVSDHLTICPGAIVKGASTVLQNITTPGIYGSAISVLPDKLWNRCMILISCLPKLFKKVKSMEQSYDN